MTVIVLEADVSHMTAVGAVLVTRSLGSGTGVLEEVHFAEVVGQRDHLLVVGPDQRVDVRPVRALGPHPEDVEAQHAGVRGPVDVLAL